MQVFEYQAIGDQGYHSASIEIYVQSYSIYDSLFTFWLWIGSKIQNMVGTCCYFVILQKMLLSWDMLKLFEAFHQDHKET